jgi:hypothetical protein
MASGLAVTAVSGAAGVVVGQERRYTIAVANRTEEPGVTIEGTGFTGRDVRESFVLAARALGVDLVFYARRTRWRWWWARSARRATRR